MPPAPDHRIVLGPFQPVLEDALVAEVEQAKRADPLTSLVLLVGSNLLRLYLTRLLARRLGGVGGIRTMTFLDAASAAARGALARERLRPASEVAQRLIVRRLTAALPPGSHFHAISGKGGFEEALLDTLRDLREGGTGALDIRAAFAPSRRKARDVATLLEKYEARLTDLRLIDRPGIMARAIAVLDGGPQVLGRAAPAPIPEPFVRASRLLVYGFYDFTWLQEQFLERLLRRMPTTVFFPFMDTPAFEYAREGRATLERLGCRSPSSVHSQESSGWRPMEPRPATPLEERAHDGLARLRERLFRAPAAARADGDEAAVDPALRIVAAPGEPREATEAARAIVALPRAGVPLEEIALLYRSGEAYPRLLGPILGDLGVPFYRTAGTPLRPSRAARALMLLLDIKESDFERGRVTDFLGLCDPRALASSAAGRPAEGPRPPDVPSPADWDLLSRMAGITSGRRQWGDRLERLSAALARRERDARTEDDPGAAMPPDPRLVREARRLPRMFASLAKAIDAIPVDGSWSAISGALASVMTRFLEASEERGSVLEALEELARLQPITPRTSLGEFRRLLEFQIDHDARGEGRFQRGHLFLGDVISARGLGFRAVVLVGMVEQSFPVPTRQDPILLDDERHILNQTIDREIVRLPIKSRRSLEEKLLFTLAVGSASERLVLSFPRVDPDTARERLPSSFLLRVVEAVSDRPCDYDALTRFRGLGRIRISDLAPVDRGTALREREFDLALVAEGVARRDPARALIVASLPGRAPFFERGLLFEALRWGRSELTAVDGRLISRAARDLLARRHELLGSPLSPTRLEQYMTCPYQYFCERVLGLEPLEAPEEIERLAPGGRGTLVHAILHEFLATLRTGGDLPLRRAATATLRDLLLGIARRRFADLEQDGLAGLPLLAALEREAIEADLSSVLEDEIDRAEREGPAGLVPSHFEVRFGMVAARQDEDSPPDDALSSAAPVPLDLGPTETLLFKGRIDRIDRTPDGMRARVIDYKSGRLDDYSDNSHSGGTALQLPVYILAAETLLPGTRVTEAAYRSVSRRGGFREVIFGRESWERALEDLREVGRIARRGVTEGVFFPYPDEKAQCMRCRYTSICGEARVARFERKKADPSAAPFLEFRHRPQEEK